MTARLAPRPDGLNRAGNGRGVGATKHVRGTRQPKRGVNSDKVKTITEVRSRGFDTGTYAGCALVDPEKPLTDMQRAFVKLWASGETPLSASVKAGYADGGAYAYRMIRLPNILKLYNQEKALYEEAAQMTRKKVMDMHLEAYDAAKLLAEPSTMVAAAREIGKMCGYYEPVTIKHQLVDAQGRAVTDRLNSMSDTDLLQFIAEQARAVQAASQLQLPAPEDDVTDAEVKE